jgi:hypothetical protein
MPVQDATMKEKEIRDRIEQFLRRTARTVVVPASVGLGLSVAACDRQTLNGGAADAGHDVSGVVADATAQSPDVAGTAPDSADAVFADDLPLIAVPYLLARVPEDAASDPAADGESEAGATDRDGRLADLLPNPPPPYLILPSMPPPEPLPAAPSTPTKKK